MDGGADFILSVNDEKEANEIIQYFIHMSITYQCPVIVVIHLNPGSDKERGHLGSEIQRKCYGLITIKKEGDISVAEPKLLRKAGSNEMPRICYAYNKEKGFHTEVDAPDKEKLKNEKNMEKTKLIAEAVFSFGDSFTHTEAVSRIMKQTGQAESSAKTNLKNMVGWGFVDHGADRRYRRKVNND